MTTFKEIASGRKDLFMLDPATIQKKDGWNVRESTDDLAAHVRWLADSIKEIGVQQPLTVYMEDDVVYVSDGHCRLDAANLAIAEGCELNAVPCRVEERYSSEADRVLSMVVRNSGKPLTPLEKAEVYKRLHALGWDEKAIAAKAGVSVPHVSSLLSLSAAPTEVKDMVKAGKVAATTATKAIREHGTKATEKLAEAVVAAQASGKVKAAAKNKYREALEEIRDIIATISKEDYSAFIGDIDAVVTHNLG
jgi:ParB/RepB/Spo0J family partition protein